MKLKAFLKLEKLAEQVKHIFGESFGKMTGAARIRLEQEFKPRGETFVNAMSAAFGRQMNHNVRAGYRRNSRGLPIGVGQHQVDMALYVEKYVKQSDHGFGDTRIQNAGDVLDRLEKNRDIRAKHPGPSKLARRLGRGTKSMNLTEWCALHRGRLQSNRKQGRVPYRRVTA